METFTKHLQQNKQHFQDQMGRKRSKRGSSSSINEEGAADIGCTDNKRYHELEDSQGAFHLTELTGQTRQFAKKMQQFKETLGDNPSHCSGGVYTILELCYINECLKSLLTEGLADIREDKLRQEFKSHLKAVNFTVKDLEQSLNFTQL